MASDKDKSAGRQAKKKKKPSKRWETDWCRESGRKYLTDDSRLFQFKKNVFEGTLPTWAPSRAVIVGSVLDDVFGRIAGEVARHSKDRVFNWIQSVFSFVSAFYVLSLSTTRKKIDGEGNGIEEWSGKDENEKEKREIIKRKEKNLKEGMDSWATVRVDLWLLLRSNFSPLLLNTVVTVAIHLSVFWPLTILFMYFDLQQRSPIEKFKNQPVSLGHFCLFSVLLS